MLNMLWHCFAEISPLRKKAHLVVVVGRMPGTVFIHSHFGFVTLNHIYRQWFLVVLQCCSPQNCVFLIKCWLKASWKSSNDSASLESAASEAVPQDHFKPFHQNLQRRHQTHVSHTSLSQKSLRVHMLWRWAKSWEGWERWGNWHFLQLMSTLCHKICSIWCYKPKHNPPIMWELICLGQGGPWLADPEGKITTPEVETASGLLQERRQQRWEVDQETLLVRYLEVRSRSLVHRPADQEARFQTFYPLTAASWWVHKGQILTTCVAEWGDSWSHCSSSTCRLTVVWSSSESPWVPSTFILL